MTDGVVFEDVLELQVVLRLVLDSFEIGCRILDALIIIELVVLYFFLCDLFNIGDVPLHCGEDVVPYL